VYVIESAIDNLKRVSQSASERALMAIVDKMLVVVYCLKSARLSGIIDLLSLSLSISFVFRFFFSSFWVEEARETYG
jgi:hypothetical protein